MKHELVQDVPKHIYSKTIKKGTQTPLTFSQLSLLQFNNKHKYMLNLLNSTSTPYPNTDQAHVFTSRAMSPL